MDTSEGYCRETLADGVVIFRVRSTDRECIDALFEDVAAVFEEACEEDRPAYLVYDVRALTIPTAYAVRRAQDLARLPLPTFWKVATIVGNDFATSVINFIRTVSLLSSEQYERSRVFSAEGDALEWLRAD